MPGGTIVLHRRSGPSARDGMDHEMLSSGSERGRGNLTISGLLRTYLGPWAVGWTRFLVCGLDLARLQRTDVAF